MVELYNWKNREQVPEIYGIVELEKMRAWIAENPYNLGAYQIIEIFLVLCSGHMVLRDQNKVVFYVNNDINWDQFNQLYDHDQIEKSIQNVDVVAHKRALALIKTTNYRLEDAKEEQ